MSERPKLNDPKENFSVYQNFIIAALYAHGSDVSEWPEGEADFLEAAFVECAKLGIDESIIFGNHAVIDDDRGNL